MCLDNCNDLQSSQAQLRQLYRFCYEQCVRTAYVPGTLGLGLGILVLHFFAHMENEYVHAGFQAQRTTTGVGKWYVPSMYHTKSSLSRGMMRQNSRSVLAYTASTSCFVIPSLSLSRNMKEGDYTSLYREP